jgi:predicted ribonuclease toxin of YeeF-YezG toxin-antitoxin module
METGNLVSKLIERGLAALDKDGVHLTEAGSAAMALLEKDLSQLDKDRIDGGARKFLSEIIN